MSAVPSHSSPDSIKSLPQPGPQVHSGWSWAINDSGQIGFAPIGNGAMGIIDPIDGVREIGFPGGSAWSLWEINNNGVACGAAYMADMTYLHAYRYDYDTDTITDLGSDPVIRAHSDAYGLNDNGDIAGHAEIVNSTRHPIVWAAVLPLRDEFSFSLQFQSLIVHFELTFKVEEIEVKIEELL